MKTGAHEDVILEKDNGKYEQENTLVSFHRQAKRPISWKALLAGYLSAWL